MKSEKGQSMVELALVLPILVFIIMAIIDFGKIYYAYLTVDNAGREAARFASIGEGDTQILGVLDRYLGDIEPEGVLIDPPEGGRESGDEVKITIDYSVELKTPILREIVKTKYDQETIPVTNTTTMRVE